MHAPPVKRAIRKGQSLDVYTALLRRSSIQPTTGMPIQVAEIGTFIALEKRRRRSPITASLLEKIP